MGRVAEVQFGLLLQLMGPEAMGITEVKYEMYDPRVCRPFIAEVCLHDLFTNTKEDMGVCPKVHSKKLKDQFTEEYAEAQKNDDSSKIRDLNRIRVDYESAVRDFVEKCDRSIRASKRKLDQNPEEHARLDGLTEEIAELEVAHVESLKEVDNLGRQGKVEESMQELQKAEALEAEKANKEKELKALNEAINASGNQKLRICEVCGAYLSILDSDRRLADHFGGKMHMGYMKLREDIAKWNERPPLAVSSAPPPSSQSYNQGSSSMASHSNLASAQGLTAGQGSNTATGNYSSYPSTSRPSGNRGPRNNSYWGGGPRSHNSTVSYGSGHGPDQGWGDRSYSTANSNSAPSTRFGSGAASSNKTSSWRGRQGNNFIPMSKASSSARVGHDTRFARDPRDPKEGGPGRAAGSVHTREWDQGRGGTADDILNYGGNEDPTAKRRRMYP